MRLIDADEMLKRLESWNTDDEMDKALYNFTLNRIIEQPTVDAVPVSFIQQRIDQLQDIADFALDSNGGYIESANSSLYELKLLLSRWKVEQSAKDK